MVSKQLPLYSRVHISSGDLFQDSEETSHSAETNDTSYDRAACFHGDEAFFFLFQKKKRSKWPTQKKLIFKLRQFSIFFIKISWIAPGVRID